MTAFEWSLNNGVVSVFLEWNGFGSETISGGYNAKQRPWGQEVYQVGWYVEETMEAEFVVNEQGYQLVPDFTSPAIYLMQMLPVERDPTKTLLCFYDSGCNSARIWDSAYKLLTCETILPEISRYDRRNEMKATVTGLRIPHVTSEFLMQAWRRDKRVNLPKVDSRIGRTRGGCDYWYQVPNALPRLLLTLPSGLSVYRPKLLSLSGNQVVLGALHATWAFVHA
jgi:hypothetical protein